MLKAIGKFVGLVAEKEGVDLDTEEDLISDSKQISEQDIHGTVSSIHSDYGIINSEIFFSFDVVQGLDNRPDRSLKVGEKVFVQAERIGNYGGWRARRVVLDAESWERGDQLDEEEATVVGIISDVDRHGNGVVNRAVHFNRDSLGDFRPYTGDWVTVQCTTAGGYTTAVTVKPLRTMNFTGEINAMKDWFGFVDRDIYFRANVCEFSPRTGDRVEGVAIESSQKRCSWRVLTMKLQNDNKSTPIRPPVQPSLQCTRDLEADKEGIAVISNCDFGNVRLDRSHSIQILIRNSGSCVHTLTRCGLRGGTSQFSVQSFSLHGVRDQSRTNVIDAELPVELKPGDELSIGVSCTARNLGKERQLLLLDFSGFKIGRFLTVFVSDDTVLGLDPSQPYQRRGRAQRPMQVTSSENYLPGQRPRTFKSSQPLPVKLGSYPVPGQLRICVWDRQDPAPLVPVIKEELTMKNYSSKFSALLYLEEIQMELDIREYDMDRVCLRRFGEYLALRVPGLAEGRPSVLVGDKIILSVPGEEEGPRYEGYVHELLAEEVLLKFHDSFHQDFNDEDYDVMFNFSRTPMRRCHQVVHFADRLGEKVLFPEKLEMAPSLFTPKPSHQANKTSPPHNNVSPLGSTAVHPSPSTPVPAAHDKPSSAKSGFVTPVKGSVVRAGWKTPKMEHE